MKKKVKSLRTLYLLLMAGAWLTTHAQAPAPPKSFPEIPTAVESRAVEILNSVSLGARSWISHQAQEIAKSHSVSVATIKSAAGAHFGIKQLTANQQDAVVLAVLYQAMRLIREDYRVKSAPILPSSRDNKEKQDQLQALANAYNHAQAGAWGILKSASDAKASMLGKI